MTLFAIAILALTGCQSRLTGMEGNFTFSYYTDDDVVDFNKPIAVQAFLDLEVRETGWGQPVTLTDAWTDDEAVLAVTGFQSYIATLNSVGEGSTIVHVEGETSDGEVLTDSVAMMGAVPEVHTLSHTCTLDSSAAYLTDSEIWVPYEFGKENGQSLIGYGYYPITIQAESLSLVEADSSQQYMAFTTGSEPVAETLVSDLTGTSLSLQIVNAEDIDGIQEPIPFVLEDIDVGDKNAFFVRPMVGENVVCQADTSMDVVSDTPDICEVDYNFMDEGDEWEYGWFDVEGVAEGTCLYTVTFNESGTSAQFSYEIEP